MQFTKVRVLVKHTIMNETPVVCFQHEVPILQARFGIEKVEPMEDNDACGLAMVDKVTDKRDEHNQPIVKKIPLERTLQEEWARLMERPAMIQISENDKRPAPLVAFPLRERDLEDFYKRIQSTSNVTQLHPKEDELPASAQGPGTEDVVLADDDKDDEIPVELSPREQLKKNLDDMGIEYKGNAKTVDLQALYDEVTNTNVSSDVQN